MEENKPKRIINSNIKVWNCKSFAMGVEPEIIEEGIKGIEEALNNEIGRQGNELAYYYHSDHLGSASYITDDSGAVTQTLNYLPYGEDWVDLQNFNVMPAENNLGVYKFNGKEKDAESGYNYYGARYYDSEKISWLSVDFNNGTDSDDSPFLSVPNSNKKPLPYVEIKAIETENDVRIEMNNKKYTEKPIKLRRTYGSININEFLPQRQQLYPY
jgi:RHS repeat-associated protein